MLSDRGNRQQAEQLIREAVAHYRRLADETPEQAQYRERLAIGRSHLGQILAKQGQTAEAAAEFEAAGQMLVELAQHAPEVAAYREARAHVLTHYGDFLTEQHDDAQARNQYRRALGLWTSLAAGSESAPARNELAEMLLHCPQLELRDPPQARRLAQEALAAAPDNPAYLRTLAAACLQTGDPAGCLEALDRSAERLATPHGRALLYRAWALAQQGKAAEADASLAQADRWISQHAPDNPRLLRLQSEVRQAVQPPTSH